MRGDIAHDTFAESVVTTSLSLLPGSVFHGRYRVARCIKKGGMGAVFEVLDERTDTRRALKVMHPDVVDDADMRSRFAREARVTGGIESDHVVRVSDAGVDDATDTPFLVMELLRGADLGAVLRDAGRLPPADVVRYLGQVALGLERAHAANIVHRDLKPENLFLTRRDDGSPCVKILDFGIAKIIARRSQARDTRSMGTPVYMAPEQIRGEGTIDRTADVYALGHIAYALLVGDEYWSDEADTAGSMFAFFSRVVQGMPETPSARAERTRGATLSAEFDAWLHRAAASRPEDRFASAAAAVTALAGVLGVEAPPGLALEMGGEPSRREAQPATAGATTLTTAVGPSDPLATAPTVPTLDTVPGSVWSQTATRVSAEEIRAGAVSAPQMDDPLAPTLAAPIASPRPLPRRLLGLAGAAAVTAALAWGLLGSSARAPASSASAPADAPSSMDAARAPSAPSPAASPALPSTDPLADAGASSPSSAPRPPARASTAPPRAAGASSAAPPSSPGAQRSAEPTPAPSAPGAQRPATPNPSATSPALPGLL